MTFLRFVLMILIFGAISGCARETPATDREVSSAQVNSTPPAKPNAQATVPLEPGTTPNPRQTPLPTWTPATTASDNTSDETAQPIEYGLQVYRQNYCGICHQLDAVHTSGTFGPTHNGMGTTAELRIQDARYKGTARTAAEYILESIADPKAYIVDGYQNTAYHMPAYTHLPEADVTALSQMLLQQR